MADLRRARRLAARIREGMHEDPDYAQTGSSNEKLAELMNVSRTDQDPLQTITLILPHTLLTKCRFRKP